MRGMPGNLGDPIESAEFGGTACEGNGARTEARWEIGAPHSTDEAGEPLPRDPVEGRQRWRQERGTDWRTDGRDPGLTTVSTKLDRIAKLAKQRRGEVLTTLAHHIDVEWLRAAFQRTRKDGAAGVDGQRAEEYARNLEGNLRSLLERVKSGTYRAPPVKRRCAGR